MVDSLFTSSPLFLYMSSIIVTTSQVETKADSTRNVLQFFKVTIGVTSRRLKSIVVYEL